MWCCVIIVGLFIWLPMMGPFFPHPHLYEATLGCYILLAVSLVFVRLHGQYVLATSWLFATVCAVYWWRTTDEKSVPWFLYQNGLPIFFVLVSHVRWLLIWKINKTRPGITP